MAPPRRPPPELNGDATSEILLRLPPDDPASLLRASLVCKPWLRLLSGPAPPSSAATPRYTEHLPCLASSATVI
ncbi:hypothetical protein ACP70R_015200 [Stipagrostis hirtigluma subsp. patula]